MRWYLLAAVLGLSISDVASFAQRPPDDERPTAVSDSHRRLENFGSDFFDQNGFARFRLIQGRLELDAPRHRKGSQQHECDRVFESVTVTACRGIPSVHYVRKTNRQQITMNVMHAKHVRIESLLVEDAQRIVLDQPANDDVTLTVGDGADQRKYRGASLLHVRLDAPGEFDLHLNRLIQHLLNGTSIKRLSRDTNKLLLKQGKPTDCLTAAEIHEQVEKLRAKSLSTRRRAEQTLVASGTCVLPIIATLNQRDLDVEQRMRLKQIKTKLRSLENDTPQSLAAMLVNDRGHWEKLAPRMDRAQFTTANLVLRNQGLAELPTNGLIQIANQPR